MIALGALTSFAQLAGDELLVDAARTKHESLGV
jgi:hypothetical protein